MAQASVKIVKQVYVPVPELWGAMGGLDRWLSMIRTCRSEESGVEAV